MRHITPRNQEMFDMTAAERALAGVTSSRLADDDDDDDVPTIYGGKGSQRRAEALRASASPAPAAAKPAPPTPTAIPFKPSKWDSIDSDSDEE